MAEDTFVLKAKDKTKEAFESVNKGLEKVSSKLTGTKLAIGELISAAAFGELIHKGLEYGDVLAKQSDKLGITTQALAAMGNAAQITGVDQEVLNKALVRQESAISDYSHGIGLAKVAFEELGLTQQELMKLPADQQFEKIAGALSHVHNQTERVNIAYKIYGGRATDLLNTLALGEDGMRKIREESELFGTALGRVDAAKMEEANDAMTRIGQMTKGLSMQMSAQLAPYITVIAEKFVDAAKEAGGMGNVASKVVDKILRGIGFIADAMRGLDVVWKGFELLMAKGAEFIITTFADIGAGVIKVANLLPGVDIKPLQGLGLAAKDAQRRTAELSTEFQVLVTKPMPSTEFKKYSKEIQKEAEETGKKIAAAKQGMHGTSEVTPIIDPAADKERARLVASLQSLQASQQSQQEILRQSYIDKEFIAEDAFQQGLINDSQRMAIEEKLNYDHQKKLSALVIAGGNERLNFERMTAGQITKTVIGSLVNMTQGVAQNNKVMFEINKVAGIANAVVSTYEGAQKAYTAFAANPPLAAAMAAVAVAAGLARVQAIRNTTFSGGGGGGGGAGGGGSIPPSAAGTGISSIVGTQPQAQQAQPTVQYTLNFNGVTSDAELMTKVTTLLTDGISNNDVVIIQPNSRQAAELAPA